jgi:hypothetical protein
MATNPYFSQSVRSEQNLYEDIIIESLKMYGQDVYYLPRDIINQDRILNEDVPSRFNSSYKVEMYIENIEGFDGEGDLFTKFGVEIRDQATFVVARRRWDQTVKRFDNEISAIRPIEGDLLYIPFSQKLFEITHVEHEQPFYQLQNLPTYKLRCELFEYNDEDFDTGINNIDNVADLGYNITLSLDDSADVDFVVGNTVTTNFGGGVSLSANIVSYNDSDNQMVISHLNNSDGNFRLPAIDDKIKSTDADGNTLTRKIRVVNESLAQPTAQNDYFDTLTDFLDFSESNPFGDP